MYLPILGFDPTSSEFLDKCLGYKIDLWGCDSSDVVIFDIWPLIHGEMRIAKVKRCSQIINQT